MKVVKINECSECPYIVWSMFEKKFYYCRKYYCQSIENVHIIQSWCKLGNLIDLIQIEKIDGDLPYRVDFGHLHAMGCSLEKAIMAILRIGGKLC